MFLAITSNLSSKLKNIQSGIFHQTVRNATKKAGGSTKNGRDSPGQRLGVKKFGGEHVIPGNIIIRQRGKTYHTGKNVGLGRDYTIFAMTEGYVKFDYNKITKHQVVSVVDQNPNPQPALKENLSEQL
jgi:large subunit ribosomal protein L27